MAKRFLLLLALLVFGPWSAHAQLGSFGESPVEVEAESTRYEGGVAIAEDNVVIRYGDTAIYSDYAQYNQDTREVFVRGNVRIYREGRVFVGERAIYNLETKELRTAEFRGEFNPFVFAAEDLLSTGGKAVRVNDAIFSTSDSSKPDYYLRAKSVRIYPDDRIIFSRVTLYVGKTPILWVPYLYQSLNKDFSFSISPGYTSSWGAFVLTKYTFPITETMSGEVRLDLRSQRGIGVGFGTDFTTGTGATKGWGSFRAYYADDSNPDVNKTGLPQEETGGGRYRIALQERVYLNEDLYANIDINKLSDSRFLRDFEPALFTLDPQPDNVVSLTKWDEKYTLTAIVRAQLNDFFATTERLPEVVLDVKRTPFFDTALFYEGETSIANLRRSFADTSLLPTDTSLLPDYKAVRFDTFHQLLFPKTYAGWLSVIPRVGVRGTYYSNSGHTETTTTETMVGLKKVVTSESHLVEEGSVFRMAANAGVEASFKFSRAYEGVQSRAWGLDGLRHVVQPYTDLSYVYSSADPSEIFQFDRIIPSTQLAPIDFPQFNTIDSISNWSVWRLGVRNRLQTRRDNETFEWLTLDTYFDVYLDHPDFGGVTLDEGTFSNVFNRLRWTPLPWMSLTVDSQLPILDSGFIEINSNLTFMVNRDLQLTLTHRFIDGNPLFQDSNLLGVGAYYQVNDNWAVSAKERYEFDDGRLESQLYEVHRDLSSWVASLGFVVRDNAGAQEVGFLLTFTLKDLPNIHLPLSLDPQSQGLPGSN